MVRPPPAVEPQARKSNKDATNASYDASLVTDVLGIFTKIIFASLIRRAREFGAVHKAQSGAVSFIQRFDSGLRLNLHIHSLVIDGVYAADDDDQPQFQVLPAPDDEEIAQLTESLAMRIRKFLQQCGLGPDSDPEESDPLSRDQPWLSGVYAASVRGRVAYGDNSGRRVTRVGDQIDPERMEALASPRCATVDGFSVHANVAIAAGDRARLERLARYCARPPVAMERLERQDDGRLLYRFKRAWRDGSTHIILTPLEMLEKLSALIPVPRAHGVRYAGILAPAAKWRARIVPAITTSAEIVSATDSEGTDTLPCAAECVVTAVKASSIELSVAPHSRNYPWAELMKQVCARMSALPRTHANPRSDSFTGCDRKDSQLPGSAVACSPSFTVCARIYSSQPTILKAGVRTAAETCALTWRILSKSLVLAGELRLKSCRRPSQLT